MYRWTHADKPQTPPSAPSKLDASSVWPHMQNDQSPQLTHTSAMCLDGSDQRRKSMNADCDAAPAATNNIIKLIGSLTEISQKETAQMTRFKQKLSECNSIRALCIQIKDILKEIDPNVDKSSATRKDNVNLNRKLSNDEVDNALVISSNQSVTMLDAKPKNDVNKNCDKPEQINSDNYVDENVQIKINQSTQTDDSTELPREKEITVPEQSKDKKCSSKDIDSSKSEDNPLRAPAPPPPPPPPPMTGEVPQPKRSIPPPPPPIENLLNVAKTDCIPPAVPAPPFPSAVPDTNSASKPCDGTKQPAPPPAPALSLNGPPGGPAPLPMPSAGNAWLKNDSECI